LRTGARGNGRLLMARRRARWRLFGLMAVAALSAGMFLALHRWDSDVLRPFELALVDARFAIRGAERPDPRFVVVAFDDQALAAVNRFPIPRVAQARLLDRVAKQHPRLVVEDFNFEQPSANPNDDNALILGLRRAAPVVIATDAVDAHGHSAALGGPDGQAAAHATPGWSGIATDPGGIYRRVRHDVQGLPTMAEAGAALLGQPASGRQFPNGSAWIDYVGAAGTIPAISAAGLLKGTVSPTALTGKIVVIGDTTPSGQDVHPIPFAHGGLMSGAEIQANALDTVLRGNPLRNVPPLPDDLLIILAAVLTPLTTLWLGLTRGLILGCVALAGLLVAAQLEFNSGRIISVGAIGLALLFSMIATIPVEYLTAIRARRRLQGQFGRFVGSQVLDEVIATADDDGRLPQRVLDATVMFCDLRNFTSYTQANPETIVSTLNQYLAEMSNAILSHHGTIVTYLGDGIMAVFGAPLPDPRHADQALAAAREMAGAALARFADAVATENGRASEPFGIGIGLNSGPVTSGSIGSGARIEYTAVGDTTNQASRVEKLTKEERVPILLTDSTYERLTQRDDLQELGQRELRGVHRPVRLWAPGDKKLAQAEPFIDEHGDTSSIAVRPVS
jgi:adenylate cyclase